MDQRTITLGQGDAQVDVPVYAQSVPYLLNRVTKFGAQLQGLVDGEFTPEQLPQLLGGQLYDGLVAMIPTVAKRMPEHVFCGYATPEAMAAGEFDETAMKEAPTLPQIREAFRAAYEVNGIDLFSTLFGKLVDPTMLRAAISLRLHEALSTTSPSSQQPSGASDQTSSGTTDRALNGTPVEASIA